MDIADAFTTACDELDRRVAALSPADLDRDTVCEGWSVRQLLAHCTAGNRAVAASARGASDDEVTAARDGVAIDADVVAEFLASRRDLVAALAEPGAWDRTVRMGHGELPITQALGMLTTDRAVHAWDLARSLGGDETLDPELVAFMWARVEPMAEGMKMSGQFGEGSSGTLADDASMQDKLLDALGRRP